MDGEDKRPIATVVKTARLLKAKDIFVQWDKAVVSKLDLEVKTLEERVRQHADFPDLMEPQSHFAISFS